MFRKTIILGLGVGLGLGPGFGMVLAVAGTSKPADAQQAGPGQGRGGQFAGMQRVAGEVTAVAGADLTIKAEDGVTYQVVTTDNTRVMKTSPGAAQDGAPPNTIKVGDLKVGDGLTAMGNLDAPNKTLHAAMVVAVDASVIKAAKANLGKTYILGKVTAIDLDDVKMTVQRPDGVAQTISFDESTSFRRGRVNLNEMNGLGFGGGGRGGRQGGAPPQQGESITLADIKVGDTVSGRGSLKAGVFVPGELTVAAPGQGRRRGGDGAPGGPPPDGPAGPGER